MTQEFSSHEFKDPSDRTKQEVIFGNNFERNVYLKGEPLDKRAWMRYKEASRYIKEGSTVLDIGCSCGYGTTVLPQNIIYTGIDYDKAIIQLAEREFGDQNHYFVQADVNKIELLYHDTIIAYEFLEHIRNGVVFAQMLKKHCRQLFCSVPYNETPGHWGPHHVIHNLTEKDFPGFEFSYISFDGRMIPAPEASDGSNLLLMKWSR